MSHIDDEFNASIGLTEYRRDGWPLCPQCGDDELYALIPPERELDEQNPPTVQEYINAGLRCYLCNWHSEARTQ